jgi:hypothetical protein
VRATDASRAIFDCNEPPRLEAVFDRVVAAVRRPPHMPTPEDIATMLAVQPRFIYRLIEQDKVHFVESDRGAWLVCCASVAQNQKSKETDF